MPKTTTFTKTMKAIANAPSIRNPFVGKYHHLYYKIDSKTMRIIKALAKG